MLEQGKVVKLLPANKLEVALVKGNCGGCKGCIIGGSSCQEFTIVVENVYHHKIGDEVTLEVNSVLFYKAFLLVFIVPLTVLIGTIYLLEKLLVDPTITLLISLVVFIASYYFANKYDKKIKQQNLYKILR